MTTGKVRGNFFPKHVHDIRTEDILATDLSGIAGVHTDGYTTALDGGGAIWSATGVTDAGEAGNTAFATGLLYDAVGTQFKIELDEYLKALQFGALFDDSANDTAALLECIAYMKATTRTPIVFPGGNRIAQIDASLVVDYHQGGFIGGGSAPNSDTADPTDLAGSALRWIGSGADDMVLFISDGANALKAPRFEGVLLDGGGAASLIGLNLKSVQGGIFKDLHIRECDANALILVATTVSADSDACKWNLFENIIAHNNNAASGGAIALSGSTGEPAFGNTFINTTVYHRAGVGITLTVAHQNLFRNTQVVELNSGGGNGVQFNGSAISGDQAKNNVFVGLEPGVGGVHAITNTYKPTGNRIIGHSSLGSSPLPVVGIGCDLAYDTDAAAGQYVRSANGTPCDDILERPDAVDTEVIGRRVFKGQDDAGAAVEYGAVDVEIVDNAAGAETSIMGFWAMVEGALTRLIKMANDNITIGVVGVSTQIGPIGTPVLNVLTVTDELTFPQITTNRSEELTIALVGVQPGDACFVGTLIAQHESLICTAHVETADEVVVRQSNMLGSGVTPPAGETYRVTVFNYTTAE
jgi:hypothetical protein